MGSISRFFASVLSLILLTSVYGKAADKERVEAGRYATLKNGGLVPGTEHEWTLWRLPDGRYQFEDHFQIDKTSSALFGSILSSNARMSPEFRKSLEEFIEPSDLAAVFDQNRRLLSLKVTGKRLDGSKGEGLTCKASSAEVVCKGTSQEAKLRLHEASAFFWRSDIPFLLRQWLAAPQSTASDNSPKKIALLSFGNFPGQIVWRDWGDAPKLEPADLTIANLGPDTLVLGNQSFHVQKFKLDIKAGTGDPHSLTAWSDAKGVILAVAETGKPEDLIALVYYKNYSNPPPPPPSPADK
jgi:hypothetical protein